LNIESVERVIQRINNIEDRFAQRINALPETPTGQSFAEVLEKVEKEGKETSPIKVSSNADDIANLVQSTALKHGVNPKLALAVAKTESNLTPTAVSPAGAVGVMQLMPATAQELGVKNIYNPEENIDGGVRYLKRMLNIFGGDTNKALAAYNAGPGAVKNYNGIPPYKETQDYVLRVNELAR
jgi:soluble lytic murein transglycosylase-like protein